MGQRVRDQLGAGLERVARPHVVLRVRVRTVQPVRVAGAAAVVAEHLEHFVAARRGQLVELHVAHRLSQRLHVGPARQHHRLAPVADALVMDADARLDLLERVVLIEAGRDLGHDHVVRPRLVAEPHVAEILHREIGVDLARARTRTRIAEDRIVRVRLGEMDDLARRNIERLRARADVVAVADQPLGRLPDGLHEVRRERPETFRLAVRVADLEPVVIPRQVELDAQRVQHAPPRLVRVRLAECVEQQVGRHLGLGAVVHAHGDQPPLELGDAIRERVRRREDVTAIPVLQRTPAVPGQRLHAHRRARRHRPRDGIGARGLGHLAREAFGQPQATAVDGLRERVRHARASRSAAFAARFSVIALTRAAMRSSWVRMRSAILSSFGSVTPASCRPPP